MASPATTFGAGVVLAVVGVLLAAVRRLLSISHDASLASGMLPDDVGSEKLVEAVLAQVGQEPLGEVGERALVQGP